MSDWDVTVPRSPAVFKYIRLISNGSFCSAV